MQHYNQVVNQLQKFGANLNQTRVEEGSTKFAFFIDSTLTPSCTTPNEGIKDPDPMQVIIFKTLFIRPGGGGGSFFLKLVAIKTKINLG